MIRSLTGQPAKVLQKREGKKNLKNWLHFKQVVVTISSWKSCKTCKLIVLMCVSWQEIKIKNSG